MSFTHLHVHSHYTLLDALGSPYHIIGRAEELHMGAIALTDSGVMYGAVDFYQACKGHNLKPIIGAEVFVAHKSRFDRSEEERKPYQLVLLASNNQGYLNLI